MKNVALALSSALVVGSVVLSSTDAFARDHDHAAIEAGMEVGAATKPDTDHPTPLGFGLGARAGIEFYKGLYLGADGMYYFGADADTPLGTTGSGHTNSHSIMLGGDLGYSFHISLLTIRPQIGLGAASITSFEPFAGNPQGNATVDNFSVTHAHFYFRPGLVGFVSLGPLYVGADVNALLITATDEFSNSPLAAFTFNGELGIRL
ncbi:MAG TPA: hypothetical protein VF407_01340 [Polyangiaceae bacterium]